MNAVNAKTFYIPSGVTTSFFFLEHRALVLMFLLISSFASLHSCASSLTDSAWRLSNQSDLFDSLKDIHNHATALNVMNFVEF